jgi:hypothetical protein
MEETSMRGRYPAGLEYVDKLDGAAADKERLKVILETLFGEARLLEACTRLGIRETRFHQLRDRALQGALDAITPRPAGRPSRQAAGAAELVLGLEQALAAKDLELQQALVREEVALILQPRVETAAKKGRRSNVKLRKQKPR